MTAIEFAHPASHITEVVTKIKNIDDSYHAGHRIAEQLPPDHLKAILLISPGIEVNGSALVEGVSAHISPEVCVFGGLAGDNGKFLETSVLSNAGVSSNTIVAIGIYGTVIRVANASEGGWRAFGPRRRVSNCDHSLLHEIDGHPALSLYKRYLGPYSEGLPANGLLFPLEMIDSDRKSSGILRTILGIDEHTGSIRLAGSVEPGSYARLMLASTDSLMEGAEVAAARGRQLHGGTPSLALCVSCVGRKMVMGARTEEEIQCVREQLGSDVVLAGFYSYGEIGARDKGNTPRLHNQTMSIFLISEELA